MPTSPSHSTVFHRILYLVLFLMTAHSALAQSGRGDREVGLNLASRSAVLAQNGIAATSHPLASQIAIDILKQGGTAVDAAIAANAALGLMEPTGCGIGGDLYAIVWDPGTKQLHGLNASGRSPLGLSYEAMSQLLKDKGWDMIPDRGSYSVSVPGAVDGWFELHDRFGKLDMKTILNPSIQYARHGFPITQLIASYWKTNDNSFRAASDQIEELDNYRKTLLIEGKPPVEGQVFRNPDLATTYEKIALGGREAFYNGELADAMDAYMKRIGGPLRKADLEAHTSDWVEPVSVNYRGYDVYELPPNGQGIAALQMLNILEGYDLASMGHNSADYLHVHTEAKKLAFEDRARFYADMDFYDAPLKGLLSKEYADERRALIDMKKALDEVDHGDPRLLHGDTIYLTVADKNGMMVSLIQSNYRGLGSGLMPDGLGFMFQDRGALFTMEEGHPNVYEPGKRPFHTIIPAFVTKDGEPYMSFGLMGGPMQPQGHAQIITNMVDFGMNVQEAGDAARYQHLGSSQPTGTRMTNGGILTVESGVHGDVQRELVNRGHRVQPGNCCFGGYQAILWDAKNNVYHGATEMRKDGTVAGY
ncbi:MAG: gamma-glutamyltransferase [Rhodothermaceae bacterium]|nr:gamma-glutamyltransferase [Rhodothermaceae bacterium]